MNKKTVIIIFVALLLASTAVTAWAFAGDELLLFFANLAESVSSNLTYGGNNLTYGGNNLTFTS